MKFGKEFLCPSVIITSYILYYAIPDYTRMFSNDMSETLFEVCKLLIKVGLVIDPITLLFLSKHYRNAIFKGARIVGLMTRLQRDTSTLNIPLGDMYKRGIELERGNCLKI